MKSLCIIVILFFFTVVFSCTPQTKDRPKKPQISPIGENDHRLVFFKIDDYAKILINDSLVYDTSEAGLNPDDIVEINLNTYLQDKEYDLTVEIYNARCDDCLNGNSWEVNYEYYANGELVDYVTEKSGVDYTDVGLSMSKSYKNISFSK